MSTSDTTYLRDMSHYDGNLSLIGYAGTTHKITEGKGYVDPAYAGRMPGLRAANRVLGSYHVLHTADPAGQLQFWIEQQDKLTPWWRDWPHWIMQIDAEKWPGDPVSLTRGTFHGPLPEAQSASVHPDDAQTLAAALAMRTSTTVAFAGMLKSANLPGLQVCYASRGQYGDNLSGIPLDLWNAAYRGSSYPGNSSPDWRPYSGHTPVFWQYTSTPYDKNAFRGSTQELLAYIDGGDVPLTDPDKAWLQNQFAAVTAFDSPQPDGTPTSKIGRLALTQGVPNGTRAPGKDGQYPRDAAWKVLTDLGAEVAALRAEVAALKSSGTVLDPDVVAGKVADLIAQRMAS